MHEVIFSRNFGFVASVIVLLCLSVLIRETKSFSSEDYVEPEDKDHGPFDCVGLMREGVIRLMGDVFDCGMEAKDNASSNNEFAEKIGCVVKCVMQRAKLLTEDYMLTDENLLDFYNRFTPSPFLANEVFQHMDKACGKLAKRIDPNEKNCFTYSTYVICIKGGFESFMNRSKYCIKTPKKKNMGR